MTPFYPTRQDLTDPSRAERVLRLAFDLIYANRDGIATANDALTKRVLNLEGGGNAKAIRTQLQITGDAPLNVQSLLGTLSSIQPSIQTGTHAARLAAGVGPSGTAFFETDRFSLYVSDGTSWIFRIGAPFDQAQAGIAALAATLGSNDTGLLIHEPTYEHTLRWSGAAFAFAPGDPGGGYIVLASAAPVGAGWVACDGAAHNVLTATGGLAATATPAAAAGYVKLAAAYNAARAAGGRTTSDSAGTPSGTVSQPTFTGNALGTHQHQLPYSASSGDSDVDFAKGAFGTGGNINTTVHHVLNASAETVASEMSSSVSAGTPSGTVSQPTFTGNALAGHDHGPNTLELAGADMLSYLRI